MTYSIRGLQQALFIKGNNHGPMQATLGLSWKTTKTKSKKLTDAKKNEILDKLGQGISVSPVLTALQFRFRALRGRFYGIF